MADDWVVVQKKTFTRWANSYIGKRGMKIEDLATDLGDGILLANLLELLSDEKLKHNKTPKIEIQKLENLNACITFIKAHDIPLVNIGSKDIFSGSEKLILGLLWTLILRWEINDADGKAGLLLWVQRSCKGYRDVDPPNVQNFFAGSWSNGLPFCAIINRYRPDLLNYDSLSPANAEANCDLAFSIAEEKLGITKLLDADDVAAEKVDDKSIVAYVSQFFKLFAKENKNDALLKSIKNAVEVTKRHDAWISTYESGATDVKAWAETQTAQLSASNDARTTEGVKSALDSFSQYMKTEKPERQTSLAEVETTHNTLSNSKKNNKRPDFDPAVKVDDLQDAWEALERAEQDHERALLDKYLRFQQVDHASGKFNSSAATVNTWLDEKLALFESAQVGSNLTEIESNLEMHEAFEARLAQYKPVIVGMQKLAVTITDLARGEHDAAEGISERIDQVNQKLAAVEEKGAAHRAALEAARDHEKGVLEAERKFVRHADELDFELDQLEEAVNEPVVAVSAAEVEYLDKACGTHRESLQTAEARVEELGVLAENVGDRRPDFAAKVASEKERCATLHSNLNTREQSLHGVLADEQKKEALRKKFAELANAFSKKCEGTKTALGGTTGTLEQQLEEVRKTRSEIEGLSAGIAELASVSDECESANVVANPYTPHTIHTLRAMYEQLGKAAANQESSINAQILAKQSLEVSPEQLKEIEDVFHFFDQEKNGKLNLAELREACTGAGIDIPENEIEARMQAKSATGEMTLDEFTAFMLEETTSGDSLDDVLAAFRQLSGGAEQITETQLEDVFKVDPELNNYLKENVKEGDFSAFTHDLFSR